MPRLLINPGTPQQWEAPLKPGSNTVGRSPACDVHIEHGSVSGTHCEVTVTGSGVAVRDLGSTNGTFLNRAPVQESILGPGQRLQLGGVEMELIPDRAAPPAPVPASAVAAAKPAVRLAVARPVSAGSGTAITTPGAPTATPGPPPPPPPAAPLRVGLKVASHEPAPPPPPSLPDAYVPAEYTAEQGEQAKCKYHPKSLARYLCPQCQLNYCEMCVTTRPGGAHSGKFCRRCSGECVALNVQLVREHADKENFFANIPGMFAYPFKGSGIAFMIIGALFYAGISSVQFWFFRLLIFYVAYTFAYIQRVIHTAAQGEDQAAGLPDVSDFWEDIFLPLLRLLGLLVFCVAPALLLLHFAPKGPQTLLLAAGLLFLGAIYSPMAFLAVAMFDSVAAINPFVVIPAMFRVPLEYLTVLVLIAVIIGINIVESIFVGKLGIPFVPTLVGSFVSLYFLTVMGRMLGLMYFAKHERLGWFQGRGLVMD
jgi:hypothetical protein